MKEIVVISGKGGTGKTSLTASFAQLGGDKVIAADCDVDAADMHLLLQPDFGNSEDFYSGIKAEIEHDICSQCGKCFNVCRFNAISLVKDKYSVIQLNCEGCGYCARVCPKNAIMIVEQNVGKLYVSTTKDGNLMVHARLVIGAENSGKLVAKVKNTAKKLADIHNKDYVLVDGSPGVGCPVVSSLSGADFVLLVTEPTVSGFHDLKRVYKLVRNFNIKAGCIINKYDLNHKITHEIEEYMKDEKISYIAKLPYDEAFTEAMTRAQTIVEYSENDLKKILIQSWDKIQNLVKT